MDTLDTLPPLKDTIRRHELWAARALGQNFLLDTNVTDKIAKFAGPLDGRQVIEVGPGPGGLTRSLLKAGAAHVTAIELDRRALPVLAELQAAAPGRLTVIEGDAMAVDYEALAPGPRIIVANLPYNVATPLLIGWLKRIELFDSLTLMFQKEVAERITAAPGDGAYGRLAVISQWKADASIRFHLPPSAFVPPPKVTSSVVGFRPRPARPDDPPFALVERVTAAGFGQRRKMLRASLKTLGVPVEPLLEQAGILPTSRAEEVPVEGFLTLARLLSAAKAT